MSPVLLGVVKLTRPAIAECLGPSLFRRGKLLRELISRIQRSFLCILNRLIQGLRTSKLESLDNTIFRILLLYENVALNYRRRLTDNPNGWRGG